MPASPMQTAQQPTMYTCYDGSQATDPSLCPPPPVVPTMYTCPDGSATPDPTLASCPAPQDQTQASTLYTCYDGSQATDPSLCPLPPDQLPVPADGSSQGMQVTPTQSPDDSTGTMPPGPGCGQHWRMRKGLLIGGALVGAFALGAVLLSRR